MKSFIILALLFATAQAALITGRFFNNNNCDGQEAYTFYLTGASCFAGFRHGAGTKFSGQANLRGYCDPARNHVFLYTYDQPNCNGHRYVFNVPSNTCFRLAREGDPISARLTCGDFTAPTDGQTVVALFDNDACTFPAISGYIFPAGSNRTVYGTTIPAATNGGNTCNLRSGGNNNTAFIDNLDYNANSYSIVNGGGAITANSFSAGHSTIPAIFAIASLPTAYVLLFWERFLFEQAEAPSGGTTMTFVTKNRTFTVAEFDPRLKTSQSAQRSIWTAFAEVGLTEVDVWEGDAQMFPIVYQYKAYTRPQSTGSIIRCHYHLIRTEGKTHVLSFNFPADPIFTTSSSLSFKKTYHISPRQTVGQIIQSICKKLEVKEASGMSLSTIRGFVLQDDAVIGSYGFGSILPNWELNVSIRKPTTLAPKSPILDSSKRYKVHIRFPPLKEFRGLFQKTLMVGPNSSARELIQSICKQYDIVQQNPDAFVLATDYRHSMREDIKSSKTADLLLLDFIPLSSYGLGDRTEEFDTQMLVKEMVGKEINRDTASEGSEYRWIQLDYGVHIQEARFIILSLESHNIQLNRDVLRLDAELHKEKVQRENLREENEQLNVIINAFNESITILQGNIEKLEDHRDKLMDTLVETQRQYTQLSGEHKQLMGDYVEEKSINNRLKSDLDTEREALTRLNENLINQTEESSDVIGELKRQIVTGQLAASEYRDHISSLEASNRGLQKLYEETRDSNVSREKEYAQKIQRMQESHETEKEMIHNLVREREVDLSELKQKMMDMEYIMKSRELTLTQEKEITVSLAAELEAAREQNERLKLRLETSEGEKKNLQQLAHTNASDAETRFTLLNEQLSALQAKLATEEAEITKNEATIQRQQSTIDGMEGERRETERRLRVESEERDREVDRMRSEMEKAIVGWRSAEEELKRNIFRVETITMSDLDTTETKNREIDHLKEQLYLSKQQSDVMENQIRDLNGSLQQMREASDQIREELSRRFGHTEEELMRKINNLTQQLGTVTENSVRQSQKYSRDLRLAEMNLKTLSSENENLKKTVTTQRRLYEGVISELKVESHELKGGLKERQTRPPPPPMPPIPPPPKLESSGGKLNFASKTEAPPSLMFGSRDLLGQKGNLKKTTVGQKAEKRDTNSIGSILMLKLQERFKNVGNESAEELDEVKGSGYQFGSDGWGRLFNSEVHRSMMRFRRVNVVCEHFGMWCARHLLSQNETLPALTVNAFGGIELPLQPRPAKKLRRTGERTTEHTSQWKAGMESNEVYIEIDKWISLICPDVQTMMRSLGKEMKNSDVELVFHSMILQEMSDVEYTYPLERDEGGKNFGYLLVTLPTFHTGGEMIVSYGRERRTYDTAEESLYKCRYLSFFKECTLTALPITEGRRLQLLFHLSVPEVSPPLLFDEEEYVKRTEEAIRAWREDEGRTEAGSTLPSIHEDEELITQFGRTSDHFTRLMEISNFRPSAMKAAESHQGVLQDVPLEILDFLLTRYIPTTQMDGFSMVSRECMDVSRSVMEAKVNRFVQRAVQNKNSSCLFSWHQLATSPQVLDRFSPLRDDILNHMPPLRSEELRSRDCKHLISIYGSHIISPKMFDAMRHVMYQARLLRRDEQKFFRSIMDDLYIHPTEGREEDDDPGYHEIIDLWINDYMNHQGYSPYHLTQHLFRAERWDGLLGVWETYSEGLDNADLCDIGHSFIRAMAKINDTITSDERRKLKDILVVESIIVDVIRSTKRVIEGERVKRRGTRESEMEHTAKKQLAELESILNEGRGESQDDESDLFGEEEETEETEERETEETEETEQRETEETEERGEPPKKRSKKDEVLSCNSIDLCWVFRNSTALGLWSSNIVPTCRQETNISHNNIINRRAAEERKTIHKSEF
ncbi:viral A-type inclusion protein [Planoprotostelium fungivorum]|uniref:Viral A-type inclusion protein n=1 Tax=Planoprotostelium fungivorum TaxID=1890364 RepID=A0A2P6NRG7_9EUKA|nr:viral A-type inclusion protein [Planoprotostelium fungivorum]